MAAFESAIYKGKVGHRRTYPKVHAFDYNIYLWWLNLDEVPAISKSVKRFHSNKTGFKNVCFNEDDYLQAKHINNESLNSLPLKQRVLGKMTELANEELDGDVFFLGQTRTFGMFFSPVNFWFLRRENFDYMLAEVSNTPWNERHFYLVDLHDQQDSNKQFHVSPFNPMDMIYKWRVKIPNERLHLQLSCFKETKHFEASLDMQKLELNSKSLRNTLLSIPSMTIKTVAGIYWQALKLFVKRMPIYSHPQT